MANRLSGIFLTKLDVALILISVEMGTRAKALSLYRSLLRSSRTWPGPEHEKQYIKDEAVQLFRKNQHLSDSKEIKEKIFEGETRHEIAWHYKIPYPRLHNLPTGSITETSHHRVIGPDYKVPVEDDGDAPGLRANPSSGNRCYA